ncbi:hypothetical protein F2Q68_00037105 [Brassica cretica]|uniref:AT-hook motif nuclear-localized protein n=1 Tax=Brassica cretica TaxID=69181 RepID=A0A8S9H7T7_BRACR|nr:hypothetical protein F2Q68_00037105 [Brassica cretica]
MEDSKETQPTAAATTTAWVQIFNLELGNILVKTYDLSINTQDIAAKIVAFTHQGRPLEYCILSASGAVSIAVLRHSYDPNNPTGVVTAYMISGSFLNTERTRYSGSTDQMYHLRLWPGTNTLSKQMVRGSTSLDLPLYSFSPSELSSSR